MTLGASAEDIQRIITAAELLGTATDVDSALSITNLIPSSGVLFNNGDGTWTFTPGADDDTAVTFTYEVSDGEFFVPTTATLT